MDTITSEEEARRIVRGFYPRATKLTGNYSGGNDSGGYDAWLVDQPRVTIPSGLVIPGLTREPLRWEAGAFGPEAVSQGPVPVTVLEVLESVYWDAHGYGSFAGEFEVDGVVTIDLLTGKRETHGSVGRTAWSQF